MRIAIVGAGVAGLTAARLLAADHEVTVFEAESSAGGHAQTVEVTTASGTWGVDTGFVVFNDRCYPNFEALLDELGVAAQPTHMGFSVSAEGEDFEYAGTPAGLFAQRRNVVRPRFHRMLADLARFNRATRQLLDADAADLGPSLGEHLAAGHYSTWFTERLIGPQVSAIWSTDPSAVMALPARFMAHFFANHGLLGFRDRPQWRTVSGGSRRYVEAIVSQLGDRVLTATPVINVTREDNHVAVTPRGAAPLHFDEVVLACHADQTRALLGNPTPAEDEVLTAFAYQRNETVLHTDATLLPRRRACHQAWNYHLLEEPKPVPTITYGMNHLQALDAPEQLLVTLNRSERIDPAKIIDTFDYAHPVFTARAIAAQARHGEISGADRIHYAGAYWRWGFHEDGVVSAIEAVARRRERVHQAEAVAR